MGALRFTAGSSSNLKWTTLATTLANVGDGAWTAAYLLKRAVDDTNFHAFGYLLSGTGSGTSVAGVSINAGDTLYADVAGGGVTTTNVTGTTETYMIVGGKASGNVFPRFSRYAKSANSWVHDNANSTTSNQIAATMLQLGSWQNSDYFDGWMGVAAFWEGNMSDTDRQNLVTNWQTSDLWSSAHGQPAFLAELNVAGASVVDLAGNASSLTSTAMTLDNAETLASWNFNGTGAGPTPVGNRLRRFM